MSRPVSPGHQLMHMLAIVSLVPNISAREDVEMMLYYEGPGADVMGKGS